MRNTAETFTILLSFLCLFVVVAGMYVMSNKREEAFLISPEERPVAVLAPLPAQPKTAPSRDEPIVLAEESRPEIDLAGDPLRLPVLETEDLPGLTELEKRPILVLPETEKSILIPDVPEKTAPLPFEMLVPEEKTPPAPVKITGVVALGDSVSSILSPYLAPEAVQRLVTAAQQFHSLTHIHIGQPYAVIPSSKKKGLDRFEYEIDANQKLVVARVEKGYKASIEAIHYDYKLALVTGTITSSLFDAMKATGENPNLALSLAEIFTSEINFIKDLRQGDRFSLLLEKKYRGTQFKGYRAILGAKFVNQGKTYEGYRFVDENGMASYYNAQGESLKKMLLKAPLSFTRISSGYSMNRKHPVFFDRRPHQGVDYAAPSGTPVKAVGDGMVTKCGWGNGFGKMIIVNHANGLESMYSHLSGFAADLKKGKRVKQGQTIGYVGATGVATGPHLDFRLKRNGKYINPTKAINPRGASIPPKRMATFRKQQAQVLAYMNGKKALASYSGKMSGQKSETD